MTTVEQFFDNLSAEYLDKSMIRYINMANFRSDFIDKTYKLIEFTRNAFSKNGVNSLDQLHNLNIDVYIEITSQWQDISFWFNKTAKSDYIVDNYYADIYKYIETMANNTLL